MTNEEAKQQIREKLSNKHGLEIKEEKFQEMTLFELEGLLLSEDIKIIEPIVRNWGGKTVHITKD